MSSLHPVRKFLSSSPVGSPSSDRPNSFCDDFDDSISPITPSNMSTPKTTSPYMNIAFNFKNPLSKNLNESYASSQSPDLRGSNYNAIITTPEFIMNNNNNNHHMNGSKRDDAVGYQSSPNRQTGFNESSQSIAAVRAALHDAKSRFFGLSDNPDGDVDNRNPLLSEVDCSKPAVQVIKPQPRYQNVPENSAIFKELSSVSPKSVRSNHSARSSSPISEKNFRIRPEHSKSVSPQQTLHSSKRHTKSIPNGMDFGVNNPPSQTVYMATTVPQNLKANNIAGRHTPTRNSLRHSRMLVVNKNYAGVQPGGAPNPLNLRHPTLAKILLNLQIIIGVLITFIGMWILLWAPHTRVQDNPYWSGIALILAGSFGLCAIRCRRVRRLSLQEKCFICLKFDSYFFSLVAAALCLTAFVCATIHLSKLVASDTKCKSVSIIISNAACICVFNWKETNSNSTTMEVDNSYDFKYRDLSCTEVEGGWKIILGMSMTSNIIGFILSTLYLSLVLCFRQDPKGFYSNVHTGHY